MFQPWLQPQDERNIQNEMALSLNWKETWVWERKFVNTTYVTSGSRQLLTARALLEAKCVIIIY